MSTATAILLATGIACLFVGALSGIPMGLEREKHPEVPKYLTMVHLSGYMQGPLLMVVGLAIAGSTVSNWVGTAGAAVLSFSAVLLITKDFLNWRQGVSDEFAEKSLGLTIGRIFGPIHIIGLVICSICIVSSF